MSTRRHGSSERLEALGRSAAGADSDEALMERFCGGERAALDALFARHAYSLFQLLRRMVHDEDVAEDLLQTSFLSLVKARDSYQLGSPVVPWLHAIAANAARDWLRRQRRHREEALTQQQDQLPEVDPVEPEDRDPQLEERVLRALERLPPSQREAVLLHRIQGLSFREVARSLGTTVGAAKVRAHRGYQRLRRLLGRF
jgi:RNA polymerase sigma-70 factor (ECF subfamily)